MNRQLLMTLAAAWLTMTTVGVAADDDWHTWRGPNRDGKSPATGLLKKWPEEGPKKLWEFNELGRGFSTVAISDGVIYATGDVGGEATTVERRGRTRAAVEGGHLTLFALNMDGEVQWTKKIDEAWTRSHPGTRSTPTIDGDRLYLLTGHGLITCRDKKTGDEKWSKKTADFGGKSGGWGYAESILILGDLAIVKPGGDQCVVALDKHTGNTVWTSSGFDGGPEYSSCVPFTFENRLCVATGTRAGILCVDPADGTVLWSDPWSANNTANCPDPAYADGRVFWANGYNKGGICLELSLAGGKVSAKEAWTTRDMVCHHGGYVIHEGHIYGNHSAGWSCLDLKTGEEKWNERGVGKGSVLWADDMLYLFSESRGRVGLAKCLPDRFEMTGEFSVAGEGPSWAHPVVAGGRLYLRYDKNLYCFDVKAR